MQCWQCCEVRSQKATGDRNVTTQDLLERRYELITRDITVSAATSGNHGRALAWGAQQFGCRCIVYMNEGFSAGREAAIAAYGAQVVRVPGSFDEAVLRCFADAESLGLFPSRTMNWAPTRTCLDGSRRASTADPCWGFDFILRGDGPDTDLGCPSRVERDDGSIRRPTTRNQLA